MRDVKRIGVMIILSMFLFSVFTIGVSALEIPECFDDVDCAPDNNYCEGTNWVHYSESCIDGVCLPASSTADCDNGLFCDGQETCSAGVCYDGDAPDCSELDNACGEGICDDSDGCIYDTFTDNEGPVTSDLSVVKLSEQCKIDISALETDECSNIEEAEYFLGGASCGAPGAGYLMDADDGDYDELIEEIMKSMVFVSDGSINVHVRGKDSENNWGNCQSVQIDLDCLPPDYPTCERNDLDNGVALNGECNIEELLICGDDPELTANICDDQSRIQLAEYFIDEEDPLNWNGIDMDASDGEYNEQCEDVEAIIDITELEDGTHYVQLHGKDGQENWGKFEFSPIVSFIKDTTAPDTEKEIEFFDGRSFPCETQSANGNTITNGCYYVKNGTRIFLNAEDPDPQGTGEFAGDILINYNVWYSYDCETDWTLQDTGQGEVDEDVMLTLDEDSCHLIEYWAEDSCGNEETHHYELDIVDNKPPITIKTVGEPKVDGSVCNEYEDVGGEPCERTSRTYTIDADFDEGNLNGVEHDSVSDQLQLVIGEASTFPVLWVANAGEDTLSRWNTETNEEEARYHTWFGAKGNHGAWSGPAPSRTAVDSDGNAYVANRHFDNKPANVFKILTDDWVDRNGNGVLDTSNDANSDGVIDASEMIQFTDDNANGVIEDDEINDERIAWVATVGTSNCLGRSLAIDLDGDIWLGCYNEQAYYKLDGNDGGLLEGPISVSGHTPYGALVDKHGILWGASLGNNMLRLDTSDNSVQILNHNNAEDGYYGSNYGIAIGYDESDNTQVYLGSNSGYTYIQYNSLTDTFSTPAEIHYAVRGVATDADGNIIAGAASNAVINLGGAAKFAPNGSLIWMAPTQVGASETRGTVVASDGNVWLVHVYADMISKINGVDGTPMGAFDSGIGPYTYSDATGVGFSGSISSGTWTTIYDTGADNTELGPVSWSADVPAETTLTVRVRSSNDQATWSPWETISSGVGFSTTPDGRYLEIDVSMKSSGENSPILYDLTVDSGCSSGRVCINETTTDIIYITSQTPITLNCTDQEPHPIDAVSLYWELFWSEDCEDPTWDSIEDEVEEDGFVVITGLENSCHKLVYHCEDALGNTEEEQTEIDAVDNQAPIITKEVIGPQYGICPPEPINGNNHVEVIRERDDCYIIDGVTEIHVSATDPEPHPVNDVDCSWSYTLLDGDASGGEQEVGSEFVIQFPEESMHELTITCWDALGNSVEDVELFIVDKTPPVTEKTYGTPFVTDQTYDWITSDTNIELSASDQEPHPSGVSELFWRVTLLDIDDEDCTAVCNYDGSGDWESVEDDFTNFNIDEDSCHLIEYYSVDNVDKTEEVNKQCVFVDNAAPETTKEVGEPKYECEGEECDYYVSGETPINLTCEDLLPHPVGDVTLHWNIFTSDSVDCIDVNWGEPSTYSENSDNVEFYFEEDSCHKLVYWCEDALGNTEEEQIEIDNVDSQPPVIIVHNPTQDEREIERCAQSIVIEAFDEKSGVDRAWAELWEVDGEMVREVELHESVYGTWEALMDKSLPAGDYILAIHATDNLGNEETVELEETLLETVFVEYVSPASCNINPENGGSCDFEFHLCMRGDNSIQFWMNKLGTIVTPDMMSATISNNGDEAFVGLQHCEEYEGEECVDWFISDAEELILGEECVEINGKTQFNLHLDLDSNVTSQIGVGAHDLEYWMETSLESDCDELIVD